MKSNKQRRTEIRARRAERKASRQTPPPRDDVPPPGSALVDRSLLAPHNSYGEPRFAQRGYYEDLHFTCADCGTEGVWTAHQQKWWYEVAKGYIWSTARRCRPCRRKRKGLPP